MILIRADETPHERAKVWHSHRRGQGGGSWPRDRSSAAGIRWPARWAVAQARHGRPGTPGSTGRWPFSCSPARPRSPPGSPTPACRPSSTSGPTTAADPGTLGPLGNHPALAAPDTRDGTGWTVRHSLWLLPTLLLGGLGAWLSFGYIAARHQRLSWLALAATYLALAVAAIVLIGLSPDNGNGPLAVLGAIGVWLLIALWPVASIHGLWVNFKTRLPLLRAWPR
jgi:hypothetical protein